MKNKIAFNFLSCQCHEFGRRENCCQGDQARIDLKDAVDDPASMNEEIRAYIRNICSMTEDAIGDERLPPGREARSYCVITEDTVGSDDGLPLTGELPNTNIAIATRPDSPTSNTGKSLRTFFWSLSSRIRRGFSMSSARLVQLEDMFGTCPKGRVSSILAPSDCGGGGGWCPPPSQTQILF